MSQPAAARPTHRALRTTAIGLVFVTAAIIELLVYQSASSSASSSGDAHAPGASHELRDLPPSSPPTSGGARVGDRRQPTEDDGVLPDGVTAFEDEYPGVANLDPGLLLVLRGASKDAALDGIELDINSGWRSTAYQDQLLRDARSEYGSADEAARWVATAATSPHVAGDAVDIGPARAATWLATHGAGYGLCRVYRNEPWHFEVRPEAVDQGCPRPYADPTRDPRMRG